MPTKGSYKHTWPRRSPPLPLHLLISSSRSLGSRGRHVRCMLFGGPRLFPFLDAMAGNQSCDLAVAPHSASAAQGDRAQRSVSFEFVELALPVYIVHQLSRSESMEKSDCI